jgi:hypothetical protein
MEEDHRRRLWNEHGRFKADPRFKEKGIFRMELECSEDDFFNFFPPYPKNCKFCAKEKANLDTGDVWCYETLTLFPENYDYSDFHCPAGAYEAIRRSPEEIHSLNKKKRTVLRQCLAKGIQLCWRGDREAANEAYKPDLQAWMQDNYVELLKLEEYNDLSYLQEKKSRLEVELQAINGSLQRLGVTV